jgi:hypothetical protein
MGNSRGGRHIGVWEELTIQEREVLRKRDPSIAGFITEGDEAWKQVFHDNVMG